MASFKRTSPQPPTVEHHRVNQTEKQFSATAATLRPGILFQLPGLLLSWQFEVSVTG